MIDIIKKSGFKPALLPNFKKGEVKDLSLIEQNPTMYKYSVKHDGVRAEIFRDGTVLGRSLKPIKSKHIKEMAVEVSKAAKDFMPFVLEAEIYSPELTFPEIIHFTRTEDVTSDKTKKKYEKLWIKSNEGTTKDWEFPGRDVEFLTTWPESLKFYLFDMYDEKPTDFETRMAHLEIIQKAISAFSNYTVLIKYMEVPHIDALYQAYDQAIIDGEEGLVVKRKKSMYKFGRYTLKSGDAFKLKDDEQEYDGQIISVEEATYVNPDALRTTNELGRSVTSKLKEDRIPAGYAKGFKVRMDDGRELIVGIQGYNRSGLTAFWKGRTLLHGTWITFTGMEPVKKGGVPRHAFLKRFRDNK